MAAAGRQGGPDGDPHQLGGQPTSQSVSETKPLSAPRACPQSPAGWRQQEGLLPAAQPIRPQHVCLSALRLQPRPHPGTLGSHHSHPFPWTLTPGQVRRPGEPSEADGRWPVTHTLSQDLHQGEPQCSPQYLSGTLSAPVSHSISTCQLLDQRPLCCVISSYSAT